MAETPNSGAGGIGQFQKPEASALDTVLLVLRAARQLVAQYGAKAEAEAFHTIDLDPGRRDFWVRVARVIREAMR
jgi:hypothetical protein